MKSSNLKSQKIPLQANSLESTRQEILRRIQASGYPPNGLLLNSSFLGKNGQNYAADIIVFSPDAVLHIEPLLVVSIAKNGFTFSYEWVNSFQDSGAKKIIWFNGKILKLFYLNSQEKYQELPPFLPNWAEINQENSIFSQHFKSNLTPAYDLKQILSDLHDHFYGNSNIRIPSRLGTEIQKIILLKKFDEEQPHNRSNFYIAENELPQGLNGDKIIPSDAVVSVANRLRKLLTQYDLERNEKQKLGNLDLDDQSLYHAVFQLERLSLKKTPTDVLGDALEAFRVYTVKREGGQFFTHRYVVDLALHLVGFTGEKHQTLADISCGTSGFLHSAKNIIINKAQAESIITEEEQNNLVSELLIGLEVDQDLVQISNTSPEFFSLPKMLVERQDSLAPYGTWKKEISERIQPKSRYFMVGNPPFGTKIVVKDTETLKRFSLAYAWKKAGHKWQKSTEKIVSRSPDILFIERNLDFLIPGIGRMVLVVPYQILSGPKEGFVREWLMTNCKIIAIVDLPEDTFQPYTGTKGSLLVVEKRLNPNPQWRDELDYPIFMACPQKIGHDRRGRPIFKNNESAEIDVDLPEISTAYDAFLAGNNPSQVSELAFTISSQFIKNNSDIRLNAAYYRPSSIDLRDKLITIVKQDLSLTITPLGDLVKDIFYPGRFKREYTEDLENSVPFLGGSNITQLIPVTEKRILKDSIHYQQLALKAGWILITRSGTTGIVSSVPQNWEGFAASEHIIRIIPDPEKLHPGYLYGYLKSEIGQNLLKSGIFGSVIDEINSSYIASIPVLHPQDKSYADKIGGKMYKADLLRYQASILIQETTQTIENLII
ncbi:N-6 DNA methylase [Sphaerospermopsis sp. FACHB-1194]|uniref:N-6 DNA methylase n=1 Tax=Sphaerospermopsis sp. FACHB-1194 TaxID=2692862 RepID=UPI0016811931|nr:N-6 DNA methylase [Sphaerospermopsis sp. FACHB-1194]MBD2146290.1 N-6 DNA methylase [Sphaerospermopsis sp. FACHB-1194]